MLLDDVDQTIGIARASMRAARAVVSGDESEAPYYESTLGLSDEQRRGVRALADSAIDPVASFLVAATNGVLYQDLVGRLDRYPIPNLRMPAAAGASLLDLGCSWGRWSIAAARLGFDVVGVDPSLGAVLAARRIARAMGLDIQAVVGDARFLPFRRSAFDAVFSYSVLQHFSKPDAETALAEVGRVLRSRGRALIQMPNRLGMRCLYHQARRGFRTPRDFEVRYWSLADIEKTFERRIGSTRISVDCFFGLGLQPTDGPIMDANRRALLAASEALRRASGYFPALRWIADSVYVESTRDGSGHTE
jgi:SAM-dependent methyltransferase